MVFTVRSKIFNLSIISYLFCFVITINHANAQYSNSNNSANNNEDFITDMNGAFLEEERLANQNNSNSSNDEERLRKIRQNLARINNLIAKDKNNKDLQRIRQELIAKEMAILKRSDSIRQKEIRNMELKEQERLEQEKIRRELNLINNRTLKEAYNVRLNLMKNAINKLRKINIKRIKDKIRSIEELRLKKEKAVIKDLQKAMETQPQDEYNIKRLQKEWEDLRKFSLTDVKNEVENVEIDLNKIDALRAIKSEELNDKNNNDILLDNLELKRIENDLRKVKKRIDAIERQLNI